MAAVLCVIQGRMKGYLQIRSSQIPTFHSSVWIVVHLHVHRSVACMGFFFFAANVVSHGSARVVAAGMHLNISSQWLTVVEKR
jgi:hypothetical protein